MKNVEWLMEKWEQAKNEYWQLIKERIELNDTTKNKHNKSGNLKCNDMFKRENELFVRMEKKLLKKTERFRRRLFGLFNKSSQDNYDGYFVCCRCKGMFMYSGRNEKLKNRSIHTFNSCEEHAGRTASFKAEDLEELWIR